MSASEEHTPPGKIPTNKSDVLELKTQLTEITSKLITVEAELKAIHETIQKKLTAANDDFTKTKDDLRSLKAQKLDSRWLAAVVAILGTVIGAGFVWLLTNILGNSQTWMQICGILGLCLLWVAFAAIGIRLLADRVK